jgi:hypothetical protein
MQRPSATPVNLGMSEPHRMVEYVSQLASEMADLCAAAGETALSEDMRLLGKKMEVRSLELRMSARQADGQART